jgi:hypothetical protein
MALALAHPLLLLISVVSIALMLIRPRGIPEVYWIGAGHALRDPSRPGAPSSRWTRCCKGVGRLPLPHRHDAAIGVGAGARGLRLALVGGCAER